MKHIKLLSWPYLKQYVINKFFYLMMTIKLSISIMKNVRRNITELITHRPMYYYLTILVRIDPNLVAYSTDIAWVHFLQATSYNDDGEPMCLKGNSTLGSQCIQPFTYTLHCTVVFCWDKYMITNGIWQNNQHKHMEMGKKKPTTMAKVATCDLNGLVVHIQFHILSIILCTVFHNMPNRNN